MKKPGRRFAVSAAVIAAAVAAGISLTILIGHKKADRLYFGENDISLLAANESELCAFARKIGLDAKRGVYLEREITLPAEFDSIYSDYNKLQKSIGLDLYPYRGKSAKLYRCYIGKHGAAESAVATFIVCDGKIIGGDISDEVAGGSMEALIIN